MKNAVLLLIFTITFAGCQKKINFNEKTYEKKSQLSCTNNCANIKISTIKAEGSSVLSDTINKRLFKEITAITHLQETPPKSKTYEELVNDFIAYYENLKKEFPTDSFGWEAEIDATKIYESQDIINISLDYYTFTGGAHGYKGKNSLIFDLKKIRSLKIEDVIKNEKDFLIYAEKKFREKYRISPKENINSTGFMFENDKFVLPNNIFFQEKGILLYYNTYEIAAYVEGPKELFFKYSEVNKFLKIK